MWRADPAEVFGTPAVVADLATAGFTLMGTGLALVEAFTKLIVRNKPKTASAPKPASRVCPGTTGRDRATAP